MDEQDRYPSDRERHAQTLRNELGRQVERERARFRLLVNELAAGLPEGQRLYLLAGASRIEAAFLAMSEKVMTPREE